MAYSGITPGGALGTLSGARDGIWIGIVQGKHSTTVQALRCSDFVLQAY